jgi:hypothetical protein
MGSANGQSQLSPPLFHPLELRKNFVLPPLEIVRDFKMRLNQLKKRLSQWRFHLHF